jgi:hypothetical protein
MEDTKSPKNTKLCRYGLQCKFIKTCFRAHTKEEYQPIICRFKEGCYNLDCKYYHPSRESIDEYIDKCRRFKQKIKKFTKFCNKMTATNPCKTKNCPFAHSIEEFVIPYHLSLTHKAEQIEKILGFKLQPFMFQPSYINHKEHEKHEDEQDNDEQEEEKEEEDNDEQEEEEEENEEDELLRIFINRVKRKQE